MKLICWQKSSLFRWQRFLVFPNRRKPTTWSKMVQGKKHSYMLKLNRRVQNRLESHLFRRAEKNVQDKSIFQNWITLKWIEISKSCFLHVKLWEIEDYWELVSSQNLILSSNGRGLKKSVEKQGFHCQPNLPIFSIFEHFEKLLNFERLL